MQSAGQTEDGSKDWRPWVAVGLLGAVTAGVMALNWYAERIRDEQDREEQASPYARYRH